MGKQLGIFQWDKLASEVVNSLIQKYLSEISFNELPMSHKKDFCHKSVWLFASLSKQLLGPGFPGHTKAGRLLCGASLMYGCWAFCTELGSPEKTTFSSSWSSDPLSKVCCCTFFSVNDRKLEPWVPCYHGKRKDLDCQIWTFSEVRVLAPLPRNN